MPNTIKQPAKAYSTHYVLGLGFNGFHRINYLEWGKEEEFHHQETLLCVHGLTRNARDFDFFAGSMCDKYRVVCPDVIGRGDSDGIIGMVLASVPQSPIRRLVVNDIGPEVSRDALMSIAEYIGKSEEFKSQQEVENYLRKIYPEFAPMTDDDWAHMAKYSSRRTSRGTYRMKVDSHVGDAFRDSISFFNVDMWEIWEKITCPVLVLRGKDSSFLSEETTAKMLTCGPQTTVVEFENTGHTPTLRNAEQVKVISEWLDEV